MKILYLISGIKCQDFSAYPGYIRFTPSVLKGLPDRQVIAIKKSFSKRSDFLEIPFVLNYNFSHDH
jgi:hypothetical protein